MERAIFFFLKGHVDSIEIPELGMRGWPGAPGNEGLGLDLHPPPPFSFVSEDRKDSRIFFLKGGGGSHVKNGRADPHFSLG